MKGVVLAGGLGTRLRPLTRITNKHLLPVYDKPMIFYPIQTLVDAGIRDVLVVTGGNAAGDFLRLLGNGKDFGLDHLNYAYQEGEGGIAQALSLAEPFARGNPIVVMLGDNLVEKGIAAGVRQFGQMDEGALVYLKEMRDPRPYGVPVLKNGRIVGIEEKPQKPKSNYAVIGVYMYDETVFDLIRTLKPSKRGELEVTDLNNAYMRRGLLHHEVLKGWWADAGESHESLLAANELVAKTRKRQSKCKGKK
ncbi:MAG: sugar phosphate nucleotidyltransferase [Verrucomicrobiae bacterium]|nr:sugar phosphate nucleotidyltransferase [Verrucomicrobiae bacterium]